MLPPLLPVDSALSAFLFAADTDAVRVPLAMLIVFSTAKLLSELCERIGQPGIVGEILAGFLVGPAVLHWIEPSATLDLLSELGVLFLLFRVGLEVKPSALLEVGGTAFVVATLGVIMPFFAGWGIMAAWGAPRIEGLFVGAAMVATSVGITAQVLSSKGLIDARASRIILAAAVIDDILGLLVLALVSSIAEGEVHAGALATTALLAIGFTLILAKWGANLVQRILPRLERRLTSGEVQFNLALIVLFGLSVLAAYVGIAAIVGAFLAGMVLAETVNHRVHDLAHGITELLLPFFLAGIGLNLNPETFTNPSTLLLTSLILVAAVATKWIGCGLGAYKMGRSDMLRIGVGMIPRGEVGMVVAQLGLSLKVIPKPVYGAVVTMAILTTMIAPPLLKWAFRQQAPVTVPEEEFELN